MRRPGPRMVRATQAVFPRLRKGREP
ncbi:protein of unknown function (plasmid) [Azospirillum baldaniorum]|uniref:Uncharacterized protein n=1 Tax=Azospirillum baldaniorum TaxID=1064539 RepID=A0A9P1JX31_9PROT|nr:protein of unknown function [Azospirillum baldaniorum]